MEKMSKLVGIAHNVTVLGSGETTVVLGHGGGSDQSVWKHLVPHLVDKYKVILYDDMGAGTTDPDLYDFQRYSSVEGYVDDLIAILEELNVERCIYVGHSLSPLVAAIASISRPQLFRKVIMLAASPRLTNTDDYHGGMEPEKIDQMKSASKEKFAEAVALGVGDSPDSVAVQEFMRTVSMERPDISLNRVSMLFSLDLRPYLGQVTVPCHIIQSSNDVIVPVEVGEYIHRSLGGRSVLEVIPTKGHMPHLSSPEVTNPVLLRHIRQDIVDEK